MEGDGHMCLAIPHRIVDILDKDRALARAGAVEREIRIDLIDQVQKGDDVLVHAGFAIQKVTKEDGEDLTDLWDKIREMAGEF